ncbi:hypothetical protein [Bartonella sp. HY406]|uniref:hypothetical protein n=1 Tax=Bartonella sp. HY406 TaxID=2979331 RepID=UPI0021C70BB3|nr:hypothetical protein [Bartonella sp. HY406]UXN03911.1 hypothetical protein N6B01_02410 [Bartonella sp. HY406]
MNLKKCAVSAMVIGFSLSTLAGCGGRAAKEIAITNPTDSIMDCAGISREFEANERQVKATLHERNVGRGKNVALGAASIVFFPALFFMDPKSPEAVEIAALRNRNGVLTQMAATKRCAAPQSQLTEVYRELDGRSSKAKQEDRN